MYSFEYDEATLQYQREVMLDIQAELRSANPVARIFDFHAFISWSKGRNRKRHDPKEIELVTFTYRDRKESHLLKNLPLDQLATEIYGRDGESFFNGYYHTLDERLAADIRGLR